MISSLSIPRKQSEMIYRSPHELYLVPGAEINITRLIVLFCKSRDIIIEESASFWIYSLMFRKCVQARTIASQFFYLKKSQAGLQTEKRSSSEAK